MENIAKENELEYTFSEKDMYDKSLDVVFFANVYEEVEHINAKTVFLCHGTGTKKCGFDKAFELYDIVLVEGTYRFNKFSKLFSNHKEKMHMVGYSKLDSAVNITDNDKKFLFEKYGFDTNKKTILYAPTFFPSSIEKMSDKFPEDFKECNIIVKPHYISLERKRYKGQRKKFDKWTKYPNCKIMGVEEYNLVPFLAISDVLISDESSAIFEFAAFDRPVVINRFLKLRLSYYLNPKKLLSRMDKGIDEYRTVGYNPRSYDEMRENVKHELDDDSTFRKARLEKTEEVCGVVDGKVSERIYEVIKGLFDN
jgi:CDP-glycerol glycerophosphotransferase (TagB/SpsB family)